MEKTTILAAGFALTFVTGFELGARYVARKKNERLMGDEYLQKVTTLLNTAFVSVINRAIEFNWDKEQIEAAMAEELEFFKLALD